MRTRLLNSLTADEKTLLADFILRNEGATERAKEGFVLARRRRIRAARKAARESRERWGGVPTRDYGDPERFEELEGRAFCGPRYAYAQCVWALEDDVFTAAGAATTRSRCDLEGDLEESNSFAAVVHMFQDQWEQEDLMCFLALLEQHQQGLATAPYDDHCATRHVTRHGDISVETQVWRWWDHGPLGGRDAHRRWRDEVIGKMMLGRTCVDKHRRDNIGSTFESVAHDRFFWRRANYLGIQMPEVVEVSNGMTCRKLAEHYGIDIDRPVDPREQIVIRTRQLDPSDFEDPDAMDDEPIVASATKRKRRNGTPTNGHAVATKAADALIVASEPPPAPVVNPDDFEQDDGDGSIDLSAMPVIVASP